MYNPSMLPSGDATRLCPYDKTHVILAKSFNSHLIKCRQSHKGHRLVPCQFDKTHVVPKPELAHHHSVCPSRYLLDRDMQKMAGGNDSLMGQVDGPNIVNHTEDYDWELDTSPAYHGGGMFNRRNESYYEEEQHTYIPPGAHYKNGSAERPDSYDGAGESFQRLPHAPPTATLLTSGHRYQTPASMTLAPAGRPHNLFYEYSVTKALGGMGVGRGRGIPIMQDAPPTQAAYPAAALPSQTLVPAQAMARGRGVLMSASAMGGVYQSTPGCLRAQGSVESKPSAGLSKCAMPTDVSENVGRCMARGRGHFKSSPMRFPTKGDGDSSSSSSSATMVDEENQGNVEEAQLLRIPNAVSRSQGLQVNGPNTSNVDSTAQSSVGVETRQTPSKDIVNNWLTQQPIETEKSSSSIQDISKMNEDELAKLKRRLEKKLKQVCQLEQKVSRGESLSQEEEIKLQSKSDLVSQLIQVLAVL